MIPLPWSPSALDDFVNCGRAYHAKRVIKSVVEERSEQQLWGEKVHKHFEERLAHEIMLPDELIEHEPYLRQLEDKPGHFFCEQKIAIDKQGQPCGWDVNWIWGRGIIDYLKVHETTATIVDYKTGRPHQKFRQLGIYAIHTFMLFDDINLINAQYYWTKTTDVTKKTYGRDDIPALWGDLLPDLKQYKDAFATDTWQPRQSGLCKAHCPVLECEFNGRS